MIWRLAVVLLLVLRLFLATQSKHGDMYNLVVWGRQLIQSGPVDFYTLPKEVFTPYTRPDQPPGSLLLAWFSVGLHSSLTPVVLWLNSTIGLFPSFLVPWWPDPGNLVFLKLPGIVADVALALGLARFGLILGRPRTGRALALVYLVNPALWYNSSFWGQTDSVVAAFALWSLVYLAQSRLLLSSLLLGLSLITKPSWAPFLILWLVYVLKNFPARWWTVSGTFLSALATSLPFHPRLDLPLWLTNLHLARFLPGGSAFITVNAFNFWSLFFAPNLVPDATLVFGLPIRLVAYLLLAPLAIWLVWRLCVKATLANLIWTSLLLFWGVFLFAPRMHERYFYPVFPLLSLTMIYRPTRKWLWFVYGATSALYLVNLYYDWWAPYRSYLVSLYTPGTPRLAAAAYLLAFLSIFALKSPHAAKN